MKIKLEDGNNKAKTITSLQEIFKVNHVVYAT